MDRNWLEQKYQDEYMTCAEIGVLVGMRGEDIRQQLIKLGIPRRARGKRAGVPHPHTEAWIKNIALSNLIYEQLKDEEWLRERYEVDGLSCQEIADIVGCKTSNSVWKALKIHGIARRAQGLTPEAIRKGVKKSARARRGKPSSRKGFHHSKESKEKISKSQVLRFAEHPELCGNNRFRRGWYKSKVTELREYYQSSYELVRFKQLDEAGVQWTKRHGLSIEYEFKGSTHRYVPDILVEGKVLEEIKGSHLLRKPRERAKLVAGSRWCLDNHLVYKILTETELGIK